MQKYKWTMDTMGTSGPMKSPRLRTNGVNHNNNNNNDIGTIIIIMTIIIIVIMISSIIILRVIIVILRTNGVNANGAAAKVMNFDTLGKKVRPGIFGKINVG